MATTSSTVKTMKIGILLAGRNAPEVAEVFGEYDRLFYTLLEGRGFEFEVFEVVDMKFPNAPTDCDGWLISGSRHGVYEDWPFIKPLEDFIRKAYAQSVPLVGICFGHQIIAQALGGKVEKFDKGWSVGPVKYAGEAGEFELIAWHQDQVTQIPEDAKCLAGNDFCENALLVYGDRAFSMQPHPEFHEPFYHELYKARSSSLPEDYAKEVEAKVVPALDAKWSADLIENFFRNRNIGVSS